MRRTDRDWQRWGEIDPYYAVASIDRYRQSNLASNRDAFFEEGERYVERRLNRAGELFGFEAGADALDFGCGVGRLVIPLARRFDHVIGVDISEAMLRECRLNLQQYMVSNVDLRPSAEDQADLIDRFAFVNSFVVLQHIPVKRGMTILAALLRAARHGGVANIQLTINRGDGAARSALYWAQRHVPGVHGVVNLLRGRRAAEPLVQMNAYPLDAVLALFAEMGFGEVDVEHEQQGRIASVQLIAQRVQPDRDASRRDTIAIQTP